MQKPGDAVPETSAGDRLLTITEVAELTRLSVGTLYHFVSQHRIPVVRLSRRCVRFRRSQIFHWWEDLSQPAVEALGQMQPRLTSAEKASKKRPAG